MIESKDLKQKIAEILSLCQTVTQMAGQYGSAEYKAAELKLWETMTALDSEAVQRAYEGLPGGDSRCVPGRLLRFGVADGYACYIVLKVNKKTCKLVHIPIGDAYRFLGVDADGEVIRDVVEDNLAWAEVLAEAFKKAKTVSPTDLGAVVNVEPRFPVVAAEID